MYESVKYENSEGDSLLKECLEERSILQECKNLKQENEIHQQELHVLRRKLEASNAFQKELQEANETLEKLLADSEAKSKKMLVEREEKYRAKKNEYETHITELEMKAVQHAQEMKLLYADLKKYKDLMNQQLHDLSTDKNVVDYEKEVEVLVRRFESEKEKGKQLEIKLINLESQHEELKDILRITKSQLEDKSEAFNSAREEIAISRLELASLKITPPSDITKGNSLFAEVEDQRQQLLAKLKELENKYQQMKQEINSKSIEIKMLKTENASMIEKWENNEIDTMQENANLLDNYKRRIFNLESKLVAEIRRNIEKEVEPMSNGFNYTETLLAAKKKEIKRLNEQLEMQDIQILIQEEVKCNIAKQFRYWRSKAMSQQAHILAIKAQLETAPASDNNKTVLQVIENHEITSNFKEVFEEDDLGDLTSENNMSEWNGMASNQKEFYGKALRFATGTKDTENKPMKKSRQQSYPIISISDDG